MSLYFKVDLLNFFAPHKQTLTFNTFNQSSVKFDFSVKMEQVKKF